MEYAFDGGRYMVDDMPELRLVPIEEILEQHKVRYILRTRAHGDIVLKHITKRMKGHLDVIRAYRYPKAAELDAEASIVYPIAMAEGADSEAIERANAIAAELAPTMDIYALGCIELPFLTTSDDLDAFWEALEPVEQEAMRQMLIVLTAWDRAVDYSYLEICERFNVEVVDRGLIRSMTYEQYLALHSVVVQEHEATRKLYSDIGVRM